VPLTAAENSFEKFSCTGMPNCAHFDHWKWRLWTKIIFIEIVQNMWLGNKNARLATISLKSVSVFRAF